MASSDTQTIVDLLEAKDRRIEKLENENEMLRDAVINATSVIEALISGKRVVNLDEALAFYKSVSAIKP